MRSRSGAGPWAVRRLSVSRDAGLTKVQLSVIIAIAGTVLLSMIMAPMLLSGFPSFIGGGAECEESSIGDVALSGSARSDIPSDYLRIYQDAASAEGVQWNVLAAVGKRETDHGRSDLPGVKSGTNFAGAAGPMQFLISTWGGQAKIKMPYKGPGYATDGDGDGFADVYNPADAIPGAARMLKRNGAPASLEKALFAYNHAMWYVRQVLEIARRYAADGAVAIPRVPDPSCDLALPPGAAGEIVRKILEYALAQQGKPYVWGGTGPGGFDCSGLPYMAFRAAGLSIPRTTFEMYPFGASVQAGQERPGDFVFFNSGPGTSAGRPGHMGMVVAKGKMIEARCVRCGPIKVTTYANRPNRVGFTRPLATPALLEQLKRLEQR